MTVSLEDKKQDRKLFVRIDLEVVKHLVELVHPNKITPDLITKVIEHCHECDKWSTEHEKSV